jgi:hypothetical protein
MLFGREPHAVHSSTMLRNSCTQQLSSSPAYHGWYRRRHPSCYSIMTHDTFEMLNGDNA